MRLIKIKKMHLPLSAQPRRTTIDDMIRWESSGEVKGEKKKNHLRNERVVLDASNRARTSA